MKEKDNSGRDKEGLPANTGKETGGGAGVSDKTRERQRGGRDKVTDKMRTHFIR